EAVPSVGKDDAGLDVEEFSFLYRRDKAFRKDRTIRRADRIVNEFDRRFDRTRFVTEDPIDLVRPVDNIRGRIDAVLEFEFPTAEMRDPLRGGKVRFALAKSFFGGAPVRNVAGDPLHSKRLSVLVCKAAVHLERDASAVLSNAIDLVDGLCFVTGEFLLKCRPCLLQMVGSDHVGKIQL